MSDIKQLKRLVMELESKNYNKLIFYQSGNGYHKLAGHSTLIYAGHVAKRIGRRFNLRPDTDHYSKSSNGIISVIMNEELQKKLLNIKITLDKTNENTDLVIYELPFKFSKQDLEQFHDQLKQEEREINKIVLPKSPIPTLYTYINDLTEMIYHNSKNMPRFGSEAIGTDIFKSSCNIHRCYLNYANGSIEMDELANTIIKNTTYIKNQMKIIETVHLINNKKICSILETLIAIERLVKKYAKKS